MSTYTLVAIVTRDADYVGLEFQYTNGSHVMMTFSMEEPGDCDWESLAKACSENRDECQDWGPGNGETLIEIRNGKVIFRVGKYGDGCGGNLDVNIPAAECIQAFQVAATLFKH